MRDRPVLLMHQKDLCETGTNPNNCFCCANIFPYLYMLINNNTNFICDNIYVHFFCSKTMNLSENNNGCIDLKNGYLTISVASSRKNISQKQDKIQKIGSGNQVVTLSYKSWDFGPIYARYGSDGCGVSSCSVVIKNII